MISHKMADAIKKMRIISKENKQVYTGIASAQNQKKLDNKYIKTGLDQDSGEIFIDKAI